jgi:hypothetical protein
MPRAKKQPSPVGGQETISAMETPANRAEGQQENQPHDDESRRKAGIDRTHAFNPLAWLMEGATGLTEELRRSDLGLSEEFWMHANAARRETLYALRAVVDSMIARLEMQHQQEQAQQERRERRGNVEIT